MCVYLPKRVNSKKIITYFNTALIKNNFTFKKITFKTYNYFYKMWFCCWSIPLSPSLCYIRTVCYCFYLIIWYGIYLFLNSYKLWFSTRKRDSLCEHCFIYRCHYFYKKLRFHRRNSQKISFRTHRSTDSCGAFLADRRSIHFFANRSCNCRVCW